jgi:hypothetical protein
MTADRSSSSSLSSTVVVQQHQQMQPRERRFERMSSADAK